MSVKQLLEQAVERGTKHPAQDLRRARELGEVLLEKLQHAVGEGTPREGESWLWGEKENAVSLWVKLSGSLVKLRECEAGLEMEETSVPEVTAIALREEDYKILERFLNQAASHRGFSSPDSV